VRCPWTPLGGRRRSYLRIGWHLDTSTQPPTVVLAGATCARVQMHGASSVQVVHGCPTIK